MKSVVFSVRVLLLHFDLMQGFLLSGPANTTTTEGDTVQLNCSSNLNTTVKWILGHPGTINMRSIFVPTSDGLGTIHPDFTERFSFSREPNGFQNLFIKNINLSDTGTYTCIDDEGFGFHPGRSSYGRWSSASLIVFGITIYSTISTVFISGHTADVISYHFNESLANSTVQEAAANFYVVAVIATVVIVVLVGLLGILLIWRHSKRTTRNKLILNKIGGDCVDELDARMFLLKSKLHHVLENPEKESVTGITVLNEELFVLRGSQLTHVDVYNINDYTFLRKLDGIGSETLRAIVASPLHTCLYISDDVAQVVYRYNLSDNSVTNWSIKGSCVGLSLTSADNIMVTIWNTDEIKEYTPEGNLIRTVHLDVGEEVPSKLDNIIDYPQHCVQLSDDRLVVSHGTSRAQLHRVCIIDRSGRVEQSYGGAHGEHDGELADPRNLALDGYGNVLVADMNNNRVVLLSPSLTLLGYITVPDKLKKPGLRGPYALHFDKINQLLYIGESNKGRVFVLAIEDAQTLHARQHHVLWCISS